jgi:hypothetical protein
VNRSSHKSSLFDLRETTRRKFSIIPQVSLRWGRTHFHSKLPLPVDDLFFKEKQRTCILDNASFHLKLGRNSRKASISLFL